jgi:unsaturated chondroitin disaccharide hydrolase
MIQPSSHTPQSLLPALDRAFAAAGNKLLRLHKRWNPADGTPVFTIKGAYTSRGWTEWTQGFLFGAPLLVFEATGDTRLLELGRAGTFRHMASHLTHTGVHDHGFNNVSTYGNLLRLAAQNKYEASAGEAEACRIALKVSGAVQAARWTPTHDGGGFICSFNGPHSLFSDTVRSLRSLALAHHLGHLLMGEHDEKINLLGRLLQHAEATARYNVYFGTGRDRYDVRGRVVHESIFNTRDGRYRCPSSQQGYSPFTTWTRGLAWVLLGFAEQLEWLETLDPAQFAAAGAAKAAVLERFLETARATADFYIQYTPPDGIPYWDTGAPGLVKLGDYLGRPADPFNDHEPVDSSAAAIAAQGLLRLGRHCSQNGDAKGGDAYTRAALTTAATLFGEPYLSTSDNHEGLLLHTVYHHPNGWDHIPEGRPIPCGESCLWGDYHLLELAIALRCCALNLPPHSFFQGIA